MWNFSSASEDDGYPCIEASFNGGMLVSSPERIMRLGVVWRRVGDFDYGIYVSSDPSPVSFVFKAEYVQGLASVGALSSFLVGELSSTGGVGWEENHAPFQEADGDIPGMTTEEVIILSSLSDDFCASWLQSFGKDEWRTSMKALGMPHAVHNEDGLEDYLSSGLPFQVRLEKMPDFLAAAQIAQDGFFSFFATDAAEVRFIEKHLNLFHELL